MSVVPPEAGTYALLIELPQRSTIEVGRARHEMVFEAGAYCYVGSACGPGGLAARLQRHASVGKTLHWHIDSLLARARLFGAIFVVGDHRLECEWARWVELSAAGCTDGFGASDCRCRGHLFRLGPPASAAALVEAAKSELGAEYTPLGPADSGFEVSSSG